MKWEQATSGGYCEAKAGCLTLRAGPTSRGVLDVYPRTPAFGWSVVFDSRELHGGFEKDEASARTAAVEYAADVGRAILVDSGKSGGGTSVDIEARLGVLESWRRRLSERLRPILDKHDAIEYVTSAAKMFTAADNMKPGQMVHVASQSSIDFAKWINDEIKANRIPRPDGSPPSLFETARKEIERLRTFANDRWKDSMALREEADRLRAERDRVNEKNRRLELELQRYANAPSESRGIIKAQDIVAADDRKRHDALVDGLRNELAEARLGERRIDGLVWLDIRTPFPADEYVTGASRPFDGDAVEAYPQLKTDADFRQGWYENSVPGWGPHEGRSVQHSGCPYPRASKSYREGWAARYEWERRSRGDVMLLVDIKKGWSLSLERRPFHRSAVDAYPRLETEGEFRQGWFDNYGGHECGPIEGRHPSYREGWVSRHRWERQNIVEKAK